MTTTPLIERTATVAGKPIFFAQAGDGPSVVMLHGGGPGASGVFNYSRNIDALAAHFRVIVPDMPGYGRSGKGVDQSDPFGYLAGMIRGLLDELGLATAHLVGTTAVRRHYPGPPRPPGSRACCPSRGRHRPQPRQTGSVHPGVSRMISTR
jgi:hypothetical protein